MATLRSNKYTPGELPLGYLSWFLYSVVLSVKFCLIYGPHFALVDHLQPDEVITQNYLKVAIALSSVVFLLLVNAHHDAPSGSSRSDYISTIVGSVTVDILDTVHFLDELHEHKKLHLNYSIQSSVVAISGINMIMPFVLLLNLSRTFFGRLRYMNSIDHTYKFIYLILLNCPMLIIRGIIYHKSGIISVFLIKNIVCLFLASKKLINHIILNSSYGEEEEASNPEDL